MYRYRFAALVLTLMLVATGCMSTDGGAAVTDDSPVAFTAYGNTVTVADFEQRMEEALAPTLEQLLAQGQTREDIAAQAEEFEVRQSIFDEMIQEELLLHVAQEEGLGVDPQEVDELIEQRRAAGGDLVDTEDPEAEEELREDIARQQLIMQVLVQHTTADMFKSKHILVEDEETAQEVMEKLEAGEDFAELASEYSQDPGSAERGGEYGWIPRGDFVPEYEEAAFTSELNEPVIVESQFGYHVIVVEDRAEDRPFDDIEHLNSSGSAQQHFEATFLPWYEELRAAAEERGDLEVSEEFDPTSVPLPFPPEAEGEAEAAPAGDEPEGGEPPAQEAVPEITE